MQLSSRTCLLTAVAILLLASSVAAATATSSVKPTFTAKLPTGHSADRVIVKLKAPAGKAAASAASQPQSQPVKAGETVAAAIARLSARDGEPVCVCHGSSAQ